MKEVTRYKNEMNTLSIGKWTAEEMNFLFAILTQVRDEGCKEIKFDTYDLREYVKFDPKKPERWNNTMISVSKKLSQLVYFHTENNIFKAMPLFQEFTVDLDTQSVIVEVSRKMEYILNKLNIDTGNWTQFEFFEFATLKSVYSKTVYRFLKQYRKTGFWKVDLEDFRNLLSIPKSYKPTHIDSRVLKPVMTELPSIFKGLKVHKINHDVEAISFWDMNSLSKKKAPKTGLMTSMITQEKPKMLPLAVELQTGITLITKTKPLQKTKKCLKELSKSL